MSGPLCTQLRFTGSNAVGGTGRWEVLLSFVASKSWVECEARVIDDPTITALGLHLNLVQHQAPALIDLGAGALVYAPLKPGQEIRLLGGRAEPTGSWRVDWKNGSSWEPFVLPGKVDKLQRAEGWAHVMDDLACTALAIADFDRRDSPAELRIDAKSRIEISRQVAKSTKSLRFWLHFVNMPVHVGAVTSPQAMLAPLGVQIEVLLHP